MLAPFDRVRMPGSSVARDDANNADHAHGAGDAGDLGYAGDFGDAGALGYAGDFGDAGALGYADKPDNLGGADDAGDAATEAQQSPPPPPASARFPDAPPSTMTGTRARTPEPAAPTLGPPPSPPLPSAAPRVGTPDAEDGLRAAEYPLRPPMPPVPLSEPGRLSDPVRFSDPMTADIPAPDSPPTPSPRTTPGQATGSTQSTSGPTPGPVPAPRAFTEAAEPWDVPDARPRSARSASASAPAPDSVPRASTEAAESWDAPDARLTTARPASAPAPEPGGEARFSAPAVPPARIPKPMSPRTAAARRAVGAVDLTPGPGAGRPFVSFARPALYDDSTTRLRPIRTWVQPRVTAAAACVVLGLGLIGGAATGSWLTGGSEGTATTRNTYAVAGELWHSVPVDQLFPAAIKGDGAGPGGADRTWTRVAVAPDSHCKSAFDPLLRKALAPAGCLRLLRATYTDATRSHVTTVGLLFTKADADAMSSLRNRFTEEGLDRRPDLMPRPYAAKGTPAADFGDAQRASWTVSVLPDAPVVAFSVSGFADGRTVTEPEPAEEAMETSTTSAPAQAGLGHEAKGIADRVERRLRKTIAATEKSP
ncbi:hypothetical protein [Streptomyces sp. Je 1-332]|uniref:hypothetical protein n=1 Tax=Streptomyces sp. Je 1-332 TaxID=3231270 RepID=UPI00345B0F0A